MYLVPSNAFVPSFSQARANTYNQASASGQDFATFCALLAISCAVLLISGAKTPIFEFCWYFPGRDFCDTVLEWSSVYLESMEKAYGIRGKGYFSVLYMVLILLLFIFLYMVISTVSLMPPGLFFLVLI